ncbi:hypothetical protein [Sorangium sp. So ce363]
MANAIGIDAMGIGEESMTPAWASAGRSGSASSRLPWTPKYA